VSVYVDKLRNWGWRLGPSCHLITDGPNSELHAFADRLGLKRAWFQKGTSGPHYDLTARRRELAVRLGAVELGDKEFHAILKRWRAEAIARVKGAATEGEREAIRAELFR
jgi:hypothetical protein